MNIGMVLKKAVSSLKEAGIETAEIDAKVLLSKSLDKDSIFIYTNKTNPITNLEYSRFRRMLKKRIARIPLAYILKEKEFYGYNFYINKNVLVPRPETEWLAEKAIGFLKNQESRIRNQETNILDMGCGSGCIIISLVVSLLDSKFLIQNSNFFASDFSEKALRVARKNAKLHKVGDQIRFFHSDLFSNKLLHKKYDLIIANLPYVPIDKPKRKTKKEKIKKELDFEPQEAIFADKNGAEVILRFLNVANKYLNDGGVVFLELDPRNAEAIKNHAIKKFPSGFSVQIEHDLAGFPRYLSITSSPAGQVQVKK